MCHVSQFCWGTGFNMEYTCLFVLSLSWIANVRCLEKGSVPSHLLDCYKQPRPSLLALTVNNLVELIRKINFNSFTPVTLAQQTADILHWFSIDGLERDPNVTNKLTSVVPYHQTGFQAHKQKLFFEKLMPLRSRTFDDSTLTLPEKCTLHYMVSSSVDAWERGDESRSCPNEHEEFIGSGARLSCCPVEGGVVQTSAGPVNVGTLLAGIVAALTPQEVPLSELVPQSKGFSAHSVSNIWAATIAGDLAEVAVLQAPEYRMDTIIGVAGRWNDTLIPTRLYFSNVPYVFINNRSWQITNAEIFGGMDGLLVGSKAVEWKQQTNAVRLSQLIDRYYLDTRLTDSFHVCKRESAFNTFIRDKKPTLVAQTQNFATLLSTSVTSYLIDSVILEGRCIKVVAKFMRYYHDLFRKETCPTQESPVTRLNLFLVLDATWTSYTTVQFILELARMIDVSMYGSFITVINGDTTRIRVSSTSSLISLQQQLKLNPQDSTGLNLQKPFLTLKNIFENNNKIDSLVNRPRKSFQDIILVLGYSSTITNKEFELARDILRSMKSQNPELRFVYWTSHSNSPRFVPLTAVPGSQLDTLVPTGDSRLENVLPRIHNALYTDRSLKPLYCKNDTHLWPESLYEEYITPGKINSYWIHPDYLCNSLDIVKITFKNYEYGDLQVCLSRDHAERGECKDVRQDAEVTHGLTRPCDRRGSVPHQWDPGCLPVYITVHVKQTAMRCDEYECRSPDQVKFDIIVQDLHCITLNSAVCSGHRTSLTHNYFYFSTFVFLLLNS